MPLSAQVRCKAIIDTGGQVTIANLALRDALQRSGPPSRTKIDTIIGATKDVERGELMDTPAIGLGAITIHDPGVTFGDLYIFKQWRLTSEPAILIGMDTLGLLDTLIIDYRRHELQLRMLNGRASKGLRMINKPVVGVAALIFVLAATGLYYLRSRNQPLPAAPSAPTAAAPQPRNPALPIHCRRAGDAAAAPLPELADSDAPLRDALSQISSADAVKEFLVPQDLIRKIVVTIDNLPRQKVAVDKRPANPVAGEFLANGDELHATLDQRNFERYKPMVAVVSQLDAKQLGELYIHYYPLFQQSYQNLGYPNGYFNDRLVEVIDNLLATPEPKGPIELVRPNVMYTYADPALEGRSAGQKLLIRMGPENAKAIKAKLTELRAVITAGQLKH